MRLKFIALKVTSQACGCRNSVPYNTLQVLTCLEGELEFPFGDDVNLSKTRANHFVGPIVVSVRMGWRTSSWLNQ